MRVLVIVLTSVLLLGLMTGCKNMKKRDVGTLAGGAAGALAGSMIGSGSGKSLAIVGGAVAGGLIGHHVGKGMEDNPS
jgi:outer membrane lipoprotein SlyB